MSVTTPPQTAKPRRRWRLYAALLVLLALVAPIAYYLYAGWALADSTAAVVAETDRLDPRWRLADIEADRKDFDPDKNSALFITKLVALIGNAGPSNHPAHEKAFASLHPQHQLTLQQIDIIQQSFEKMGEGLTQARKLKDLPNGRFQIKWSADWVSTGLNGQQDTRRIRDVLDHDVMLLAQHGDPDKALESAMAVLNTARALGDEPLLISFLIRAGGEGMTVAAVERILAQGFPTAAPLAELQGRIAQDRADLDAHWVNAVRGERAGQHHLFEAITTGKIPISNVVAMTGKGGQASAMERLLDFAPTLITKDYPDHLRHMNEVVAAAQLPSEQRLARLRALEEEVKNGGNMITRLLAPAMQKVCQANLRVGSQLVAAEAALACERFRIEHKRWPESLDELVKDKKLDAVPRDPMDGEPLRFRRLADGVVIYSVGQDKQDNNGVVDRERMHEPGGDWGVRLWDAARRRQPPQAPGIDAAP